MLRMGLQSSMAAMQGLAPTLLEDVPDMAVKFAVYESLRSLHKQMFRGRQVRRVHLIIMACVHIVVASAD